MSNHLAGQTSPYLLQHQDNPVDWYPWGEEALNKAGREDKPVFLSIGYSTCHWCHVMARECFENIEVAQVLNRDFVSVKVDKEERPDIDTVYMRYCQAMTGGGGWPTSIFLDAGGAPFFAGTYFPRQQFMELLRQISHAWKHERSRLLSGGQRLTALLEQHDITDAPPDQALISSATEAFRRSFDDQWGGFGHAPKFPAAHNLLFLLHTAPELAEGTLRHMYGGGIFDHIGGGFCRYATDRRWLIPHFEKTLYDNALLAMAYSAAFARSGETLYASIARRTLDYMLRELAAPEGGFYSAQDADAEGEEGRYYLLSEQEIAEVLGPTLGLRFCLAYGISGAGGPEPPHLPQGAEPPVELSALLPRIYAYRRSRMRLHRDEKILTGWNALSAAALALAGRWLAEPRYINEAAGMLAFIRHELKDGDGGLLSGVTNGKKHGPGFLDDYAWYIMALLRMHQTTFEREYLDEAVKTAHTAISRFGSGDGGFYFSGSHNERLILRPRETVDGALPSGNAVMADNLFRLSFLAPEQGFEEAAEQQRRFMSAEAASDPMWHSYYLYALLPKREIVCALKKPADLDGLVIPDNWLLRSGDLNDYPLLDNETAYYICEDHVCHAPVKNINYFTTVTPSGKRSQPGAERGSL